MPELPRVTAQEAIKVFKRVGFVVRRQSGSHIVMTKDGHPNNLSIPDHGHQSLGRGLLNSLVKAAGMTVQQFIDIYNN